MHSYFKYDTIFASDLYGIYNGSPCTSHTDRPLILYLYYLKLIAFLPKIAPGVQFYVLCNLI